MLQALSIWENIDKAYLLQPLSGQEYQQFIISLSGLLSQTDEAMSAEAQPSSFRQITLAFLQARLGAECVGLCSHLHWRQQHIVAWENNQLSLICMPLSPLDRAAMISRSKLDKEVFWQMLLAFLYHYHLDGQQNIKHLIITNMYEWYVFDTRALVKWLKHAEGTEESIWKVIESNLSEPASWKHVLKQQLPIASIPFTCFNLYGLQEQLKTDEEQDMNRLIGLQKLLSRRHLFKLPPPAPKGDERILQELGYLLGLESKKSKNGQAGAQPATGLFQLLYQHVRLQRQEEEQQCVRLAWSHTLYVLARLLLLKVAHSCHKLLKVECPPVPTTFEEAEAQFEPYSSLLPAGMDTLSLKDLGEFPLLRVYGQSIIKDKSGQSRQLSKTDFQTYWWKWFNAWELLPDYRLRLSSGKPELYLHELVAWLQSLDPQAPGLRQQDPQIWSMLLRTPFRKALCEHFNETFQWHCSDFAELKEKVKEIPLKAANACMDQMNICNPAMGKGEGLIALLKEWLEAKHQLGLLCGESGIQHYRLFREGPHFAFIGEAGNFYSYFSPYGQDAAFQLTLYQEIRHVLSRVYVGVEAEVNACLLAISSLCLWTFSYACLNPEGALNLPIEEPGLRHAQPLVSRFPLELDIRKALKATSYGFEDYKYVIQLMKIGRSAAELAEARNLLAQFKQLFRAYVSQNDRRKRTLKRLEAEYHRQFQTPTLLDSLQPTDPSSPRQQELKAEIEKVKAELTDEEQGKWYEQAMEWRLDIPAVLDASGQFRGFDLLISYPPTSAQEKLGSLRHYFKRNYKTYLYQAKLYMYYVELGVKLLKEEGVGAWIIPASFRYAQYARPLRRWLTQFELLHCEEVDEKKKLSLLLIRKQRRQMELTVPQDEEHTFLRWFRKE